MWKTRAREVHVQMPTSLLWMLHWSRWFSWKDGAHNKCWNPRRLTKIVRVPCVEKAKRNKVFLFVQIAVSLSWVSLTAIFKLSCPCVQFSSCCVLALSAIFKLLCVEWLSVNLVVSIWVCVKWLSDWVSIWVCVECQFDCVLSDWVIGWNCCVLNVNLIV